jgi:glycosyltransferase involved in cell wall biosynthesis
MDAKIMPKNDIPAYSIVTVVFNGVEWIENTLLSVLNQRGVSFEYIVIDGGSIDGTVDVIKKYEERIQYWTSERDRGIYDAMNKGAKKARGKWINFMNAGDSFYSPTTLSDVNNQIQGDEDVVFGNYVMTFAEGLRVRNVAGVALEVSDSIFGLPSCHQAFFVRRELQLMNPFEEGYRWCADYKFYVTLVLQNVKFLKIPVTVCNFDGSGGDTRDVKIYIRERYTASALIAPPMKRFFFFAGEFIMLCVVYPSLKSLKNILPGSFVLFLKKLKSGNK